MLEQLVLIFHMLAAVAVIGLILLQQGKGADMGASFGSGASQTVFGVQGGGNLLTRWTAILATAFFLTSLGLAYFAKQKSNNDDVGAPAVIEQTVPAANSEVPVDVPAANDEVPAANSEVPSADASSVPAATDEVPAAPAAGDEVPQ